MRIVSSRKKCAVLAHQLDIGFLYFQEMKSSLILFSFLLFGLSSYSQVNYVRDTNQNQLFSIRVELFKDQVISYNDFQNARVVDKFGVFIDSLTSNGQISYGRGTDSTYYYSARTENSLSRYNSATGMWTKFDSLYAMKPVVHQGTEFFIERVTDTSSNFSWRLCSIVQDSIIKGSLNPIGQFAPDSWQRQISFRDNYRTGGLFSNGNKLYVSLVDSNANGSDVFIGQVISLNQIDSIIQLPLPSNITGPVLETTLIIVDSIIVYTIKEGFFSSLNHNFRKTASINLKNGNYNEKGFHPHHVTKAYGSRYYIDNYRSSFYTGNQMADSIVNLKDLDPALGGINEYFIFGADHKDRLYFAPINNRLEIWRYDGIQAEQYFYDSLASINQVNVAYGASAFNDTLFAFQLNMSGDQQIHLLKTDTLESSMIDLNDSITSMKPWYQPLMQIDPMENRLVFVARGSQQGSPGILYEAKIPEFTNQSIGSSHEHISQVNIFPNPTQAVLNIKAESRLESVEIMDIQGQLVAYKEKLNSHLIRLDLSALTKGTYLVKVNTVSGNRIEKIILH